MSIRVGGPWRDAVGVCVLSKLFELGLRQPHLAALTNIPCFLMAMEHWSSLSLSLPVDSLLFVWCR